MLFKKNRILTTIGLLGTFLTISFLSANKSIAEQEFVRVITDEDGIGNFLDFNSIENKGQQKFYTTARVFSQPATNDYGMPLRRPYHGQRCPCPYDFAINESICGGRASGKTTCFAPLKAQTLLISNSVNCKSKVRSIYHISIFDRQDKLITTYKAEDITGGAYPVDVEVSDAAELSVINAVCSRK